MKKESEPHHRISQDVPEVEDRLVVTYAGFILGLPGDTPASIRRDIEIIQKELPVDVLEFTMLTPLPGSEDHRKSCSRRASGWTRTSTNTISKPSLSRIRA